MCADARERPTEKPRQRCHPDCRSQPEERHVTEPSGGRWKRRQDERCQRAAASEAMDGANQKRPARQGPRTDVDMRGKTRVPMHGEPMLVRMRRLLLAE